jgi:hypothetical protein
MRKLSTLLLLNLVLSSKALIAQDAPELAKASPKLRFLLTGAFEFGGDEVAKIHFTNGESQSVRAGQGGAFGVGGQLGLGASDKFLLRGTLGFKYVTTQADNAHIRLTRVPINLTANIMASEKFRIGAGIAMHNSIKFKADGIGSDFALKNASGPIFEIAYRGVGISYTVMKYKDNLGETYSANAFGIIFSGALPRK